MLTVFLSSTTKDLAQCREAAYLAITGLEGYHCIRMEDFGSWDNAPDDFCRSKVAKCDLFVCIAGPLYGSRSPSGRSYTEREFEAAIEHGKTRLVFMTAEDFPLAANLIESDEDRKCQTAFRQKISGGKLIAWFSTPDQVAFRVVQAIRNLEAEQAASPMPTQASLLVSQIKSVSYRVAVLNHSTIVTDDEVKTAVAALQTQVHRDFAPAWGVDAELSFVAKGSDPAAGSWWLVIEDDSEYPGVLAYHTLTSEGLPQVKISVRNAKQANREWTMAASHDLLEMLANPMLNLTVFVTENGTTGKLYVREICDPVSSPQYTYKIDGVVVSNFVFPSWFESFRKPGSSQFDYGNHLASPFELAEGAYMTVFDVKDGSGWRAVFSQEKTGATKPKTPARKKRTSKR